MPVALRRETNRTIGLRDSDVRTLALAILRALRLEHVELSLVLCDDAWIHTMNREHRDEDHATDVLAFPVPASMRQATLGDVVISVETAKRQAALGARTLLHEIAFLLSHGVLHLLGFDHRTPAETRRMNARAEALTHAALRAVDSLHGPTATPFQQRSAPRSRARKISKKHSGLR